MISRMIAIILNMSNSSKIRDFFKVQGTKRSDSKSKD